MHPKPLKPSDVFNALLLSQPSAEPVSAITTPFVLLIHTLPPKPDSSPSSSPPDTHYDLLLVPAQTTPPPTASNIDAQRDLVTFRIALSDLPTALALTKPATIAQLAPHRRKYLWYQGPLDASAPARGSVRRVLQGHATITANKTTLTIAFVAASTTAAPPESFTLALAPLSQSQQEPLWRMTRIR